MKTFLGASAILLTAVLGNSISPRKDDDLIGFWSFTECNATLEANIRTAFTQARNLAGDVFRSIDWNSAAALEYFGPPEYTKPYRDRITKNLKRAFAHHTVIGDI